MHFKSSIAVLALLAVVVVAGCGGSGAKKASPAKYVSTVCSSILTWQTTVTNSTKKLTALGSQLSGTANLGKVKTELSGFVSGWISATEKLQSDIKSVGQPDVKNGATIEKTIDTAIAGLVTGFKTVKTRIDALPTGNPSAFASGASALYSSFSTVTSKLSGGLASLKSPELAAAGKKDPDCQKLSG